MTIDLLKMKERDIVELSKFKRDLLDINNILSSAEDLKYTGMIKAWMEKETNNHSSGFVKMIISDIYDGVKSQKVIDQFTPIVKRALNQYINDTINSKIQNVLNKDVECVDEAQEESKKEIVTTIEEIEAYGIIKSILRQTVECHRITYRDTTSYLGILLDDNNRKWICRVCLDGSKKHIIVSDENKNGVRYDIENLDDIYGYAQQIIDACKKYI